MTLPLITLPWSKCWGPFYQTGLIMTDLIKHLHFEHLETSKWSYRNGHFMRDPQPSQVWIQEPDTKTHFTTEGFWVFFSQRSFYRKRSNTVTEQIVTNCLQMHSRTKQYSTFSLVKYDSAPRAKLAVKSRWSCTHRRSKCGKHTSDQLFWNL